MEMGLGEWEGMPEEEVRSRYPEEWTVWNKRPGDLRLRGGESLSSLQKRVVRAVNKMLVAHRRVVAVTHVAMIRCLILYSGRQRLNTYRDIKVPNASVFDLSVYDGSIWIR